MFKIRARWMVLAACALGPTAGRDAAASATYALTDLGVTNSLPYISTLAPPSDPSFAAPQVDDSGAVHPGTGRTDAGGYGFSTGADIAPPNGVFRAVTTAQEGRYNEPGAGATTIYPPGTPYSPNSFTYAGGINASGTAVGWADPVSHTAFVLHPTAPGRDPTLSLLPGAYPGHLRLVRPGDQRLRADRRPDDAAGLGRRRREGLRGRPGVRLRRL